MESPPKISHDSFTFRFPARLWRIINSCSSGAISWGPNGKTIRILRKKFEEEYLTGDVKPFKTTKYESFVRQLNHYGFKKVKKRSAVKKITTPIVHGEPKEEAATLSEYHNPNFTRGQPERVTFLERRSQLQDESGLKKRSKRTTQPRDSSEPCQESSETKGGKKAKKDTSVQMSHALLSTQAAGDPTIPAEEQNDAESAGTSQHSEMAGSVPHQVIGSQAEFNLRTRQLMRPFHQHEASLRPLSPVFTRNTETEDRPVSLDDSNQQRAVRQRRPYYNHMGMEPPFSDPSPLPPFSHRLSPPWQRPFRPCHQSPLYDDYAPGAQEFHYNNLHGGRDHKPPTIYGPDCSRHMFRIRSDAWGCQDVFAEDGYPPHSDPKVWEPVYSMPRRGMMLPLSDGFDEDFEAQHYVGERMRFLPHDRGFNMYQYKVQSPNATYFPGPESVSPVGHYSFDGMVSRTNVQTRGPFLPSNGRPLYMTEHECRLQTDTDRNNTMAQVLHNSYHDSPGNEHSSINTYSDTNSSPDETGAWRVGISKAKDSTMLTAISEASSEKHAHKIAAHGTGSNGLDSQEQNGRKGMASAKNTDEVPPEFSQGISIITEDAADLPLDVAEETVVTCNAASTTTDYCSPIVPFSSVEETVLIDTVNDSTVSFSAGDASKLLNQGAHGDTDARSHRYSDTQLPSSHCNLRVTKGEPSLHQTSVAVAQRYLPDHLRDSASDSVFRRNAVLTLTTPALQQQTDINRAKASVGTSSQTSMAETARECNSLEKEQPSSSNQNLVDSQAHTKAEGSKEESHDSKAKVLVQREEKEDLTQLSSTSVQELLSAALRTPGMKIMVDENYHPEEMALVIPKEKRRQLNGCV